jgi:UV DNA damage endonuclease
MVGHPDNERPSRDALIARGINKQKLRAHSDFYHNQACNDWALTHWQWGDLMCEAKGKRLASFSLYEYAKNHVISQ